MDSNPLQSLFDRLTDLQSRRDAATKESLALSEEVMRLIDQRAQLESEIERLKRAIAGEPGQ